MKSMRQMIQVICFGALACTFAIDGSSGLSVPDGRGGVALNRRAQQFSRLKRIKADRSAAPAASACPARRWESPD